MAEAAFRLKLGSLQNLTVPNSVVGRIIRRPHTPDKLLSIIGWWPMAC